ncbi:MAG: hypothetical protein WBS20_15540 [Lysobacterales bacterium]
MKRLLLLVLALSLHSVTQAAEGFSTLEERMSGKEFKEAGLGKLTDAELNTLNEWLRRHSVATLENVSASPSGDHGIMAAGNTKDMRGFPNQPKGSKEDNVIHSTIVGTFDGWNAKGTLFKLANGMIWQQVEKDSFSVSPVENPQVTIERGFMHKWHLSMVGHKSKVSVKRIQ